MRWWLCLLLTILLTPARAEPVVVFAAASLKAPVDALVAAHGDAVVSYGGSGALARQVLLGAPADVVILAHPQWMDEIAKGRTLVARQDVAGNGLVVIGPRDAAPLALDSDALAERLGAGRLAMGLTRAVPAGQYGKAALEHLGLWDGVADKLAEVENVRLALMLVARGEAPLGIVYATDAQASDAVTVVAAFAETSHPAIRYPAALVSDRPAAQAFWDLLTSEQGRAAFADAGFRP